MFDPDDLCHNYTGPGLCIPIYGPKPKSEADKQRMERAVRGINPAEHANLRMMIHTGFDLNHLMRVRSMVDEYNRRKARQAGKKVPPKTSAQICADLGGMCVAYHAADATRERLTRVTENFVKAMDDLNGKQINVYTAIGKDAKKAARSEFKAAYLHAMKVLSVQAGLGFISEDTKTYMMTANHAMKVGLRKGVYVANLEDVVLLKKIAKTGQWLGWGTTAIGVIADVRDVDITYKEGGDWQKEAVRDALTLVASSMGGRVAVWGTTKILLYFIPEVGWIAFAVTVISGLIGDLAGEKSIDSLFKRLDKKGL